MTKAVLGMDGGGTKTHVAIFGTSGEKIDQIAWGPTNHECLAGSYGELQIELGRLVAHALEKNQLSTCDLAQCVFGLAGVDTRKQHELISGMIRSLGIQDFLLCNDSFLGIKAGCPSGAGICAINGTGFSVGGIDPSGQMLQIGGQGDLSGDYGGGGVVSKKAIAAVYRTLFIDKADSVMKDLFLGTLGIDKKEDFLETLLDGVDRGEYRMSDFNRLVFQAANLEDALAIEILEEMGRTYARAISGVIGGLDFPRDRRVDIVLAGSLFVRGESPIAIQTLQAAVIGKHTDREIGFGILRHPPVAGAVLWALERVGTRDVFAKVTGQIG